MRALGGIACLFTLPQIDNGGRMERDLSVRLGFSNEKKGAKTLFLIQGSLIPDIRNSMIKCLAIHIQWLHLHLTNIHTVLCKLEPTFEEMSLNICILDSLYSSKANIQ